MARCEFAPQGSTECSEGTDFVGNRHSVPTLYFAEPCVGNSHFSVQQGPSLGLKSKLHSKTNPPKLLFKGMQDKY